ncbi:unnamed protein product [Symbiodinium natans]|uniref:Pentatricopeptide repeat-containing protein-mitochondrial domain-containing protein n=1 Tax=Symbiodinium natans TaxID=878477 RepID=A0A812S7M5_9DINO|nr:unnamed protein product [Symbiodinium natans]
MIWSTAFEKLNAAACKGNVAEASAIFEHFWAGPLQPRATMVCNTVLKAYANAGDFPGAHRWVEEMQQQRVRLNTKTFGKLIESAAKAGQAELAQRWLSQYTDSADLVHSNTVLHAFARAAACEKAEAFLEQLPEKSIQPSAISYNTVIACYADRGIMDRAEECLQTMKRCGVPPTVSSYNSLIQGFARAQLVAGAVRTLAQLVEDGLAADGVTVQALVSAFTRSGDCASALHWLRVFEECGLSLGINEYNVLMNGLAKEGRLAEARQLLQSLRSRELRPDVVSLTAVAEAYNRNGDTEGAVEYLETMKAEVEVDRVFFKTVMNSCASRGDVASTRRWIQAMQQHGFNADVASSNMVLKAFARSSDLEGALSYLHSMEVRNDVSFNTAADACAKLGRLDLVVQVMDHMRSTQVLPDLITYTVALTACGNAWPVMWQEALGIFRTMQCQKLELAVVEHLAELLGLEEELHSDLRSLADKEADACTILLLLADQALASPNYAAVGKGGHNPTSRLAYRERRDVVFVHPVSAQRQAVSRLALAEDARALARGEPPLPVLAAALGREIGAAPEVSRQMVEGRLREWAFEQSAPQLQHLNQDQLAGWSELGLLEHQRPSAEGSLSFLTREEDDLELAWATKIGGPSHGFDHEGRCLLPLLCNARHRVLLVEDRQLWPHNAVGRCHLRLLHRLGPPRQPVLHLEPLMSEFRVASVPLLEFQMAVLQHAMLKAESLAVPLLLGESFDPSDPAWLPEATRHQLAVCDRSSLLPQASTRRATR